MTEQFSPEQKNEALFLQLIFTFHSAVMQHLGKIKNPLTDKIERDLEQARMSIDMLDMIKAKTQSNLTENEKNLLERLIRESKMNYVDEVDKDKKAATAKPAEEKVESQKKEEEKEEASSSEQSEVKKDKSSNKTK